MRLERLEDVARALGGIEHPDVVGWFDRTERRLMESTIQADTDDKRRELAAYARAFIDCMAPLLMAIAPGA